MEIAAEYYVGGGALLNDHVQGPALEVRHEHVGLLGVYVAQVQQLFSLQLSPHGVM